jgi:hypothetical protein
MSGTNDIIATDLDVELPMHEGDDAKAQTERGGQSEQRNPITIDNGEIDPGKRAAESGESDIDPGKLAVDPGERDTDPGKRAVDPGQAAVDPGEAAVDPGEAGVDPGKRDVVAAQPGDEHSGDPGVDPGGDKDSGDDHRGNPAGDQHNRGPAGVDNGNTPVKSGSDDSPDGVTLFQSTEGSPEERDLEARLKTGDGTAQEALAWFQTHGRPDLTSPPKWNPILNVWLFPQPGTGSGTIIAALPDAPAADSDGSGSDDTGPGGSGDAADSGSDDLDPVDTVTDDDPGSISVAPEPGGPASGGPASATPDSATPDSATPDSATPDAGPGSVGPAVEWHVYHAESTFAQETVAAGVRDMLDKNNPLLARLVLAELLPAAFIGELVEKYFVNPLLSAPANVLEAAEAASSAFDKINARDYEGAVADSKTAEAKLKEAALAIVMVIPLGGSAGKVAQGVEYLGPRLIPTAERWAVEQAWVTGTEMEHMFRVDEYVVQVDGFINKTGVPYVTTTSDMVLVEAKMASRIRLALEGAGTFAEAAKDKLVDQAARYLLLDSRLGTGGVRFVVTETGQAPLTAKLLELFTKEYPQAISSGQLKVIFTPPPP